MRGLLLLGTLGIAMHAVAQNALFRSYAEYAAAKGEAVDGAIDVEPSWGRFAVVFAKEGREQRIATRKVWGFMNNGALYRIEPQGHLPVRLMAQGAIWYWENGLAHLRMQRDSTAAAAVEYGQAAYLSRDVQGPIVPAVFKADDSSSPSAKFKAAWPAYGALLEQIGEGGNMERVRQLVVEYEVAVEEGRATGP
ncbi:MAG: hypothetical protein JST45_02470 [Bacteroidetes bacterium]|nr:hypothetical protein [Bacteroidota bacterium]